jgi:hypothetical protein
MGPATLYYGAFGATEPADSAVSIPPSSASWTDFGATNGGVTFELDQTYTSLTVDQLVDPVGARLTARAISVVATLDEVTVANMYQVMNNLATTNTQSTYVTLDPLTTNSATQPTYQALLIDGWAPTLNTGFPARRRIIIRKTLADTKLAMKFDKPNRAEFAATWTSYYISTSVAPFHVVDQLS